MNEIAFVSTVEGLELVEDCVPKPAKHFMPQWFKDIPASLDNNQTLLINKSGV